MYLQQAVQSKLSANMSQVSDANSKNQIISGHMTNKQGSCLLSKLMETKSLCKLLKWEHRQVALKETSREISDRTLSL